MEADEALKKLEKIRRRKHMPIGEFARQEIGVSRQSYSAWLNDKWKPGYQNMQRIEDYLEE